MADGFASRLRNVWTCRAARLEISARSAPGLGEPLADVSDRHAGPAGHPVGDERAATSRPSLEPLRNVTERRAARPPSSTRPLTSHSTRSSCCVDLASRLVVRRQRGVSGRRAALEHQLERDRASRSRPIDGTMTGRVRPCPSHRADRSRHPSDRGRTSRRSHACSRRSGPRAGASGTCPGRSRRRRSIPTSDRPARSGSVERWTSCTSTPPGSSSEATILANADSSARSAASTGRSAAALGRGKACGVDARRNLDSVEAPQPAGDRRRGVGAGFVDRAHGRPRSSSGAHARDRVEHLARCGTSGPPPTRRAAARSQVVATTCALLYRPHAAARVPALRRGRAVRAAGGAHRAHGVARVARARRPGAHGRGLRARATADAVAADRSARRNRVAARAARRLPRAPGAARRGRPSRGCPKKASLPPRARRRRRRRCARSCFGAAAEDHAADAASSPTHAGPRSARVTLVLQRQHHSSSPAGSHSSRDARIERVRRQLLVPRMARRPRLDWPRAARRREAGPAVCARGRRTLVSLPWPSGRPRRRDCRCSAEARAALVAADAAVVRARGVLLPLLAKASTTRCAIPVSMSISAAAASSRRSRCRWRAAARRACWRSTCRMPSTGIIRVHHRRAARRRDRPGLGERYTGDMDTLLRRALPAGAPRRTAPGTR